MQIPDVPHMEQEGLSAFTEHLQRSRVYLEYGSGGSTMMASQLPIDAVSVDSSDAWVTSIKARTRHCTANLNIFHCDIGAVKEWGFPSDNSRIRDFHKYSSSPWQALKLMGRTPDLILIDGRFRAACFLYSLLMAEEGTTILFDDYTNRPQYHFVECFCDLVQAHGRLAEFRVTKDFPVGELVAAYARSSINPE